MPWWPYWEGEWYEAILWLVAAMIFGYLFGIKFAEWVVMRMDLNKHRRRWPVRNAKPWWKKVVDLFRKDKGE